MAAAVRKLEQLEPGEVLMIQRLDPHYILTHKVPAEEAWAC